MTPAEAVRRVDHSPVVHEHEPKGRHAWRFTPGCSCGWRFTRPLPALLCLEEWAHHLEALEGR